MFIGNVFGNNIGLVSITKQTWEYKNYRKPFLDPSFILRRNYSVIALENKEFH